MGSLNSPLPVIVENQTASGGSSTTVTSSALPANAAQEAGGNLATIANNTRNDAAILDALNRIAARLDAINMTLASEQGFFIDPDDVQVN
jgi:hypothetical protein